MKLPRAFQSGEGFTLIELLIVIAIIILMATLLIPSFVGFLQGRRLRAGASKMESLLLQAKSEAIRSRRMHYLVLDDYRHRVVMFDSGINTRSEFDKVEAGGEIKLKTGSDDRSIALDAAQAALPKNTYFARTSELPGVVNSQLFSQVIKCYPDGSVVLSRSDVSTTTYLTPGRGGVDQGGDIVISQDRALYDPVDDEDAERACFMDIKPTMGKIQYEIDNWQRAYHTN